jgi:hypothetical protein
LLYTDVRAGTSFNSDELRQETRLNFRENLMLATQPQPRPRWRMTDDTMKKKTATRTTTKKSGVKRQGQIAFVNAMILEEKYTFNQILEAAMKQFPKWGEKLARCGLFCGRMRLRKTNPDISWLPEPGDEKAA